MTLPVLQSTVGVAVVCGNNVCETGEYSSCASDCVVLRSCPEPAVGAVAGGPGQCSSHGACNAVQGVCNCREGYTGGACGSCDAGGGFFWEEQLSYCRKAQEAGLAGPPDEPDAPDAPDVSRSSGFGGLTWIAGICGGALSAR